MLEALGHYKILGPIAVGRLGELLRARDTRAGRTVAIRVVANEIALHPQRRARFVEAARASAKLSHPNIAALYEIGEEQGHLFLVSEFVPGDTLKTVIAGRGLNPRHALDHGIQLADALAEAHALGVVHGAIRPATIIITPKGNAKFVDLGLAGFTEAEADRQRQAVAGGAAVGIDDVAYASPEQLLGNEVDQRTDIFSLGAVVFEMVAGRPPFTGADAKTVAAAILKTEPPAPSAINRKLPSDLDAIVLRMLDKNLDQRYESAAALAAELRSVAAMLDVRDGAAEPPILAPPKRRRAGSWIAFLFAAMVIVALLLTATGVAEPWLAAIARGWRSLVGVQWHAR